MARPLDVAIFIRAFEGGGAQRDTILLANALSEIGVSVALLTLQPKGPFAPLVAPGVEVVTLAARKLRFAFPALRAALLDRKPKAVLSSEAAPNLVTFLAARSLPRAARPRILLREVASPSAARDGDPSLQGRLAYRLIGPVYRAADRVLVLAEGARDDLVRNFGVPARNIHVMRSNAVIDARTDSRLNKAAFEHPRKRGLIVWVGRLSPEKDPLLAVEALSRLPASAGAHLQFVGDGAMSDAILARARELGVADKVTMTGHAADPFQFLLAADVAVCTSRFEGFGNAIVEALACGTPSVVSDLPVFRETLGPAAVRTDPRDSEALADSLVRLDGDTKLRKRVAEAGVRRLPEFAWSRAARGTYRALKEAAGAR